VDFYRRFAAVGSRDTPRVEFDAGRKLLELRRDLI
jgi:hypothetical protein